MIGRIPECRTSGIIAGPVLALLLMMCVAGAGTAMADGPKDGPSDGPAGDNFFALEKTGMLFPNPGCMPAPGPYYTSLVDMEDVPGFPFEYALYFSTDHDAGRGGIWLYLCDGEPSDPANWMSYGQALAEGRFDHLENKPAGNPILIDEAQGYQTETPHANVIGGKVYMTYHNKGWTALQYTMLATSPDGVNFSRVNGEKSSIILPALGNGGHTGYFRWAPNPFGGVHYKYVGYSLHGGGDNYHSAQWGSNDAARWEKIRVLTPAEGLAMDDPNMIMIWHELDPGSARKIGDNEYVAVTAGGNRASGGAARVVELYEVFLAGDGVTMTRKCRRLLPRGPAGSPDSEEMAEPSLVRRGGLVHVVYVGASEEGDKNAVMGARGRFIPEAAPSAPPAGSGE